MKKTHPFFRRMVFFSTLLGLLLFLKGYGATFNNLITITDFGAVTNLNTSLQSTSRFDSDPIGQILRTNDYQSLQLNFGGYARGRLPCRVGLFNLSQSAITVGRVPFGPRLELSGFTIAGNQVQNIEPNRFVEQVQNPQFLVYSFTEALSEVTYDIEESDTFVTCNVIYENNPIQLMRDMSIPISGYHDVRYDDLTPSLTFGSAILTKLFVDDSEIVLPTSNVILELPSGTKFKFVFQGDNPPFIQEWLIYVQSELGSAPIQFDMSYNLDKFDRLTNLSLISQSGTYTGYLRTAAIQNGSTLAKTNSIRSRTTPKWQLATQLQSMPATPISMFMLWPYDWTMAVGKELTHNQVSRIFLSDCQTVSLLLPLLARSDLNEAACWYNQMIDMQQRGETVFDKSTNSFATLVNMYIASYYDSEIKAFQDTLDRGLSTPELGIEQDVSVMEDMFDTHKSELVASAEIIFNDDGSYSYFVDSFDLVKTFPEGTSKLPLFNFPGFKTVSNGFNVVSNATNKDPIKGDINYVEGNQGTIPGSFLIKFKAQNIPEFSSRFLPDDLWFKLQGSDRTSLQLQLTCFLQESLPSISDDVYEQGKILFGLAMTAKYAAYLLLAEKGIFPPYSNGFTAPSDVVDKLQPLVDYIQDVIDAWLITKTFGIQSLSNFLVGDDDAKGVVAIKGTTSATGGNQDSGNAVYSGHNRQYGYFLGSAALKIELDRLFGNSSWISATVTKTTPAPVFTGTVKQFLDMLWRDYANPATDDVDGMPFYRYGNPWEGMSCSKGVPPSGAFTSRNNESISEDFNGYYASWLYSRAIQDAGPTEISTANKKGFDVLERFSKTNLDMIMRAGRAMFYNTKIWVYKNGPFDFNKTTGTEWDNLVDSNVLLNLGSPPCILTKEGCLYSKYKFQLFFENMAESFNSNCQCNNDGCNCLE